uniref:Uncharacterized protein TCIL3000_10_13760 n=1 Tax=Trypanosoma congolense (strain IL3000) TaxID=1068625 RepID=G0UYX3_TRYCI|nr:unnamed protein product [Trypanosoma congolense IL3000]
MMSPHTAPSPLRNTAFPNLAVHAHPKVCTDIGRAAEGGCGSVCDRENSFEHAALAGKGGNFQLSFGGADVLAAAFLPLAYSHWFVNAHDIVPIRGLTITVLTTTTHTPTKTIKPALHPPRALLILALTNDIFHREFLNVYHSMKNKRTGNKTIHCRKPNTAVSC